MVKVAPDVEIETTSDRPLSPGSEEKKKRDESVAALHEFFKELFRYLFTLACFTLVIFLDSNWSQKHNSAQLFVQNIFNPKNAPTDVNAFWNFLYNAPSPDGSVPCSGVFCTLGQLDYFSQELLAGQNGTQDAFLYFGNRLLGQVRMRQVRVQPKTCSRFWNQFDNTASKYCYPDFSDGIEETTYTKEWISTGTFDTSGLDDGIIDAFNWKSASDSNEVFIFPGIVGNYPGSGFLVDFAISSENRTQQLGNLEASHWIDIKTRAVFLDMAFYNPNTDLFITIRMLYEFQSCGAVSMMPTYRIMRLDKYPMNDVWNFVEIAAQGCVALMVLYYVIQESQEIFHSGPKEYFKNFWNTMDIANLVLFMAIFYLRISTTLEIQTNVLDHASELTSSQLQNLAFKVDLEKNLIGINCILLWAKFLKYVSAHKTFSRITRTIGLAASEIAIFFLIFALSMFGFAMGGVLILGVDNEEYRYDLQKVVVDLKKKKLAYDLIEAISVLSSSLSTLLRAAFGDFDYDSVVNANRILGPLFFFMWLLYAAVILLNMAIAIISESFVKILEQDEENSEESTIFDYMQEIAIFKTIKTLLTEEQKAENILNELENIDQDGDNLITKEEIVAFCEKNPDALSVLGVASVEDLMSKFDEDGSGQLDEDELKQLRSYIKQKRKENQERIRKLQEQAGQKSAIRPASGGRKVQTRAGFTDDGSHQVLQIEDVVSEAGSESARNLGGESRPGSALPSSRTKPVGGDIESTHSVFKSVESQVHQLGVSLESVTVHIGALVKLASLAANSGSHSFGFNANGANGSATPRLGSSLRARPEVIDTTRGDAESSNDGDASPSSLASRRRSLPAAAMSPGMAK